MLPESITIADSTRLTVSAFLAPAHFITLDIETGNAPATDIAKKIENWKAPSTWKPETVAAKRREFAEKATEKAALLDASPILCIAAQTDQARLILNGMDDSAPVIDGWPVTGCGDERRMLLALRAWLDASVSAETDIVGHNIRAFDLPKLRNAFIRNTLRLPLALLPHIGGENSPRVVDTAKLFQSFSMEHRDDFCVSLDTVAATLGIPRPKQHMDGSDCPRLYAEGQIQTVLTYCAVDVATTTRAYQLMTATAADLE